MKEYNLVVNDRVIVYYATIAYCQEVITALSPADRKNALIISDANYRKFKQWGLI